jgi:hypothetical protein
MEKEAFERTDQRAVLGVTGRAKQPRESPVFQQNAVVWQVKRDFSPFTVMSRWNRDSLLTNNGTRESQR